MNCFNLKLIIITCFIEGLFSPISIFGQNDSLKIRDYKNKFVLYTDLGFNTAPFSIKLINPNGADVDLKYRNNLNAFYGVGCNYKWFSLRLNALFPETKGSISKYGVTKYYHLGFDFTYKKFFTDIDLFKYKGFAIVNPKDYGIVKDDNNYIMSLLRTNNFSINTWYFHNKYFSMAALRGRSASINSLIWTWYLKGTFNLFNVSNLPSILPSSIVNNNRSISEADRIHGLDFGIVPGIAFVNRYKNWQYSLLGGLGGVIQEKGYKSLKNSRNFIGLAPRYDIRLMGGYNVEKWFVMTYIDIDNKSIVFNDLKYNQTYLTFKTLVGYRF